MNVFKYYAQPNVSEYTQLNSTWMVYVSTSRTHHMFREIITSGRLLKTSQTGKPTNTPRYVNLYSPY